MITMRRRKQFSKQFATIDINMHNGAWLSIRRREAFLTSQEMNP